jgi:hypothetical protein
VTASGPARGPLRPPIPWDTIRPGPASTDTSNEAPPAPSRGLLFTSGASILAFAILCATYALYLLDPLENDDTTSIGVPVTLLMLPCVLVIAMRAHRRESTFDLGGLLLLGFSARLAAAYFRFDSAVDAREYNVEGRRLAESFRRLDFSADVGREIPGTGTVRWLTGVVHVATDSTFFATFLLFVFVSFLGAFFFYRAFETGFPEGDRKRYALLVLLWPTLVYWPASLGKEACLVSAIGLASWGAARLLQHGRGGLVMLALGTFGAAMVRPHVAMIIVIALIAALLLRRSDADPVARLTAKVLALTVILIAGALLSSATAEFLKLENLGVSEIDQALDTTIEMTAQGGSAFEAPTVSNPLMYPVAAVTVLFRPFPGEAGLGVDGLLASATSLALLGLTIVCHRRVLHAIARVRRDPYIVYALSFVAIFVFVFSVVGNFGILDRQRTQMLPLYFVVLAAPLPVIARRQPPTPRVRPAPPLRLPEPARRTGQGPADPIAGPFGDRPTPTKERT